ncbi:PrsW family intramembrane metalloprotease [Yimella sp. cx-51]|uniref:PrsW family intramembrane metalloprotease n=1 Tax=Yimella sp. cx-51 TaxID=2770551 RepID=UPI00165E60B2|nr:PrsW family intramembrane metalloprotease [Yimella sp. cx-51]MBC9957108.1 PrsW family intramembrane metalloprotease [Yimella sp. cx-51]QTH37237.1 PrsW family intramembrane metalloprotease [Yimella sp. cx-51]
MGGKPDLVQTLSRAELAALNGRRPLLRRILSWGGAAVLFGLFAAIMLGAVRAQSGLTATVLGLASASVVLGIVVPVFLWLDRFEPEPPGMLLFAFLWGAVVATVLAAFFNDLGGYLIGVTGQNDPTVAVLVAPPVEETVKGLVLVLLLVFRRKEIDGIVDGMVYAGLCAAGFAFVEDIVYLAGGYAESGEEGLLGTFVVRVLMSPFAHPMFTICTGIGIGIAATSRGLLMRTLPPIIGWVCAVVLHTGWNALAVLAQEGWLLTYVLVQVPLFCGFLALLWTARRREAAKIGQELSGYIDTGWLSPAEVRMLASMKERRYARAWAKAHGGAPLLKQMVQFQDISSELAMLRARLVRGDRSAALQEREHRMLAAMWMLRRPFLDTPLYRYYDWTGTANNRANQPARHQV